MLALAGTFVYLRVGSELSASITDALRTRVDDLASVVESTPPQRVDLAGARTEDSEDSLSQIVRPDGTVVDSTSIVLSGSALTRSQLAATAKRPLLIESTRVPGVEGEARLLARSVEHGGSRFVVIAGASTQDRAEALAGLAGAFAIGGPLALILASALGYTLARLALRPVESMRRRAARITLQRGGERLPLPESADEISRLGLTLNEMLARIEASLERERAFVADASHELRTPLAILKSELELGARPDRSLAEAREAMRSAGEEVERLERLADDLLTLAGSDEGALRIERRPSCTRELLERTRERFAKRARDAGRSISLAGSIDGRVYLDPARIEGALGNLVDNALRHGRGAIDLAAHDEGDAVIFEVHDEGDGFPADFVPDAFERFSRAESGRTSAGTGLGLAIVKAIAEAHGGSVAIGSPGARRSTVAIRIPHAAPPPAAPSASG